MFSYIKRLSEIDSYHASELIVRDKEEIWLKN